MKVLVNIFLFFTALWFSFPEHHKITRAAKKTTVTRKVEVRKEKDRFTLYRKGKPYYIKGAGGYTYYDQLKESGGNSIRLWSTNDAKRYLDLADSLGLTVTLGLDMGLERHGFDYNDQRAVKEQFERIKKEVLQFKDHPALLMWGVGNELDQFAKNYKVWDAVHDVIEFIHQVDPDHPTTTMLAGVPADHIHAIIKKASNLDVLSINAFTDLPYVRNKITDAGWQGPYLIGEWGASGYWETPQTPWGTFIEETSSEKEKVCKERYVNAIFANADRCLGSYVFYWGYKQARTHTLLSLYLESGEKISVIDMLQKEWSGKEPKNKAPHIEPLGIDDQQVHKGIYLKPSSYHWAYTAASDPENDRLQFKWEIYFESKEKKEGGDKEDKPAALNGLITENAGNKLAFKSPAQEGAYRLFVYVFDGNKNVATANAPFFVKN
jgi:hypothetical protein